MLDLLADFRANDPAAALAEAALGCPYQWDPETRSLYAFSARDVGHVLTSGDFWSHQGADHRVAALAEEDRHRWGMLNDFFVRWPVFSDGDYHSLVRRAAIRMLRGVVTPELLSSCERLVTRQLAIAGESTFDWIDHVARPLTVHVLRILIGGSEAERLIELSRNIMAELAAPRIEAGRVNDALEAIRELRSWLGRALVNPASAFLAGLADLWNDEKFGPDSAAALLTQVVTGAYDPILASLGFIGERVTGELLGTLPLSVVREEVFRLATPFRFASRYARRPVTVGHHPFSTGDRIVLCLGTANLDPDRYPAPLEFRQRKGAPPSSSFGAGSHYCVGGPLARAITEVLLNCLLKSGVHFIADQVEREPELPMLRYRRLNGRLARDVRACGPAAGRPVLNGRSW